MSLESWPKFASFLVKNRYAVRHPETGNPTEYSYEDVINRVIKAIDEYLSDLVELSPPRDKLSNLYETLRNNYIVPATPILMNLGNPYTKRKTYFSCFPMGKVPDSMEGIYEMGYKAMKVYICGGGCGFDVSDIRPKGAVVDKGQGIASGPVTFLYYLNEVTATTNQGGRRKGAALASCDWRHADIEEFIKAKAAAPAISKVIQSLPKDIQPVTGSVLSAMNISVLVTEDFFKENKLVNLVAKQMHTSGDPGLLFLDNMLKYSPFRKEDNPRYSNPCGEYLAPANTACNLISINVAKIAYELWKEGGSITDLQLKIAEIAELACYLGSIIVFLPDGYPLPELKQRTQQCAPVGVGMSGLHTALLLYTTSDAVYGDDETVELTRKLQASLTLGTLKASAYLSEATSRCYKWNKDYLDLHLKELEQELNVDAFGQDLAYIKQVSSRFNGFFNAVTTSQAPTGTVSQFMFNLDSGVEPFFADKLTRRVYETQSKYTEVTLEPYWLREWLKKPKNQQKFERNLAHNLSYKQHINILEAIQQFVHTGVSKTINLPEDTTIEEIVELMNYAKNSRLKGLTVFRYGCRDDMVLVKADSKKTKPELPRRRQGVTWCLTGTRKVYITVNKDTEGRPVEAFLVAGKTGTELQALAEALGRLVSVQLQEDRSMLDRIHQTLRGIDAGNLYIINPNQGLRGRSLPDAFAQVLALEAGLLETAQQSAGDICPNCGKLTLFREGSCLCCKSCGYSTC